MVYVSRSLAALALAALGVAVWFSIVLARADSFFRSGTPVSVARAVEIAPRNAEYLALKALQLDYDGADSKPTLQKIATLNPYSSGPRIRLGLAAEMSGDSAAAERWLLDAARVDRQFEPRWTLANFYFREGSKPDKFWKWIRAALDISYGDRTPAFDLCWRVSEDPAEILSRAIPDRHEVRTAYLAYLSSINRLAAIPAAAATLAGHRDASDTALLLVVDDQLLAAHDPAALDVWRLAGEEPPKGIFNGDFSSEPLNHGFDWHVIDTPGLTHANLPGLHRIAFNGHEPEFCTLLQQPLTLVSEKSYRLQWESRTSGIQSPSGVEWHLEGNRAPIATSSDWASGEALLRATATFPVLNLNYQRPVGTSRAEGTLELRNIRLTEIAP